MAVPSDPPLDGRRVNLVVACNAEIDWKGSNSYRYDVLKEDAQMKYGIQLLWGLRPCVFLGMFAFFHCTTAMAVERFYSDTF